MSTRHTQSESTDFAQLEVKARDILLWDGACGLCRRAARYVEARDREARFLALPWQAAPEALVGAEVKHAAAETIQVLLTNGEVKRGGRAVLYLLAALGHRWARPLELPPLRWLFELGYGGISAHRYRLSRLLVPMDD